MTIGDNKGVMMKRLTHNIEIKYPKRSVQSIDRNMEKMNIAFRVIHGKQYIVFSYLPIKK